MSARPERRPISKRVRFEVFKRDAFVCQYCGAHPPDVLLEVDHIVPVAEGGGNDEGNLLTSCVDCNRGKSSVPLSSMPRSLAEKAAEVAEREEQIAAYREVMQARADRIEADMWRVADALTPHASRDGMKRDYLQSIKMFNQRLPIHDVIESAEYALARLPFSERRRFLLFCKVCWNKIEAEN